MGIYWVYLFMNALNFEDVCVCVTVDAFLKAICYMRRFEMILSLATKRRASMRRSAPLIRVHVSVYGSLRPLLIQFLRGLIWSRNAIVCVCMYSTDRIVARWRQ